MRIQFSQCVGTESTISIVKDPAQLNVREEILFSEARGSKLAVVKELQGDYYLLVEAFTFVPNEQIEFLIRVDFFDQSKALNMIQGAYIPENGGRIQVEYLRDRRGNVKVKWSPLAGLDST